MRQNKVKQKMQNPNIPQSSSEAPQAAPASSWDSLQNMPPFGSNLENNPAENQREDNIDKARAEAEAANAAYDNFQQKHGNLVESFQKSADKAGEELAYAEQFQQNNIASGSGDRLYRAAAEKGRNEALVDLFRQERDADMNAAIDQAAEKYDREAQLVTDIDKARAEADAANAVYDEYNAMHGQQIKDYEEMASNAQNDLINTYIPSAKERISKNNALLNQYEQTKEEFSGDPGSFAARLDKESRMDPQTLDRKLEQAAKRTQWQANNLAHSQAEISHGQNMAEALKKDREEQMNAATEQAGEEYDKLDFYSKNLESFDKLREEAKKNPEVLQGLYEQQEIINENIKALDEIADGDPDEPVEITVKTEEAIDPVTFVSNKQKIIPFEEKQQLKDKYGDDISFYFVDDPDFNGDMTITDTMFTEKSDVYGAREHMGQIEQAHVDRFAYIKHGVEDIKQQRDQLTQSINAINEQYDNEKAAKKAEMKQYIADQLNSVLLPGDAIE